MNHNDIEKLDIIPTLCWAASGASKEEIIADILEQE